MADNERATPPPFLKRWSQRKLAASREAALPPAAVAKDAPPAPAPATPAAQTAAAVGTAEAPLPPVESLSFDSDFTAFLRPNVDESLKRQALHKLFADPRFNVMDGLDVYIEDYGKFVPMSSELVAQLNHAKFLFDPPKTRVNEQGHVEDVPVEPVVEPPAPVVPDPAGDGSSVEGGTALEAGPPANLPAGTVPAPLVAADESKQ